MKLKYGKALVTGGSSGIGLETARLLKERGARVAIVARGEERLEQAAKDVGASAIVADLSVEEEAVGAVNRAIDLLGGLNIVINNAGFGRFAPLTETTGDDLEQVFRTNVLGAMVVAREAARHFAQQDYGNIVNIGSTAATRGFAGGTAYVASKFALRGMTECWRAELRKHNVRVMLVNPSEVITSFSEAAGYDQTADETKLRGEEIAHVILSMLELEDRGFVTETAVWATNPSS